MADTGNIDQILNNFVGGHGKYQILVTLALSIIYNFAQGIFLIHIFTAYAPPHRCRVPQCEATNTTKVSSDIYNYDWLPFVLPQEETSSNFLDGKKPYDGCNRFKISDTFEGKPLTAQTASCEAGYFVNETEPCSEYIFDNTYFDETLSTKLNLVCEKESKRKLLGTILVLGLLFGSLIGGRLGDQFGRKKAFIMAILLTVPVTIIAGHVNSFEAYGFLHFLTIFCTPIIWVNAFPYMGEIWDPKWRFIFTGFVGVPLGQCILTLIAYLNRTWTGIHIWCGVATAFTLIPAFLIPESPVWLAQNNKVEESMKVFLKMAKINGKNLTNDDETKIRNLLTDIAGESKIGKETNVERMPHKFWGKLNLGLTPLDMFKHGQVTKTIILCLAWIVTCISFYALGLNSSDLSGNIITNYFLARIVGACNSIYVPLTAYLNLGRRRSLSLAYLILGISCLVLAFAPKDYDNVILAFYLLGTFIASSSFTLVYLITSELYPTNLRSQAVGFASAFSRIFCICAPFLGQLAKIWPPFPMVIIGVPILIMALVVLKLPETSNRILPQTVQNVQEMNQL